MVPDTPARRKARELKAEARELEQEAAILAGIQLTRLTMILVAHAQKRGKAT